MRLGLMLKQQLEHEGSNMGFPKYGSRCFIHQTLLVANQRFYMLIYHLGLRISVGHINKKKKKFFNINIKAYYL